MCTLSWVDRPRGYALYFNRDELRTRRPALPPALGTAAGTRFLAPRDGDHGGTWLAVNEHGLALGLLNGHRSAEEAGAAFVSRGLLVHALIDRTETDAVERALTTRDLRPFRAFHLVAFAAAGGRLLATWRDGVLSVERQLDGREPLVSSSFDTLEVAGTRRELFHALRTRAALDPGELRLEFHRSHQPAQGPHSVCMHRPDAETVSFSLVEVDAGQVRYRYAAGSPCRAALGDAVTLPRSPAAVGRR